MKALDESGAVIMVPGGQAELVHTWRFFKQKEFVIYTRHKGASWLSNSSQGSARSRASVYFHLQFVKCR